MNWYRSHWVCRCRQVSSDWDRWYERSKYNQWELVLFISKSTDFWSNLVRQSSESLERRILLLKFCLWWRIRLSNSFDFENRRRLRMKRSIEDVAAWNMCKSDWIKKSRIDQTKIIVLTETLEYFQILDRIRREIDTYESKCDIKWSFRFLIVWEKSL
jgi:hypothetical protein